MIDETKKHSDLPASERHLGWAISAVLAGAMVTHERWDRGVYWALGNDGTVKAFEDGGDWPERTVDMNVFKAWVGFYIYEPDEKPDDSKRRVVELEKQVKSMRQQLSLASVDAEEQERKKFCRAFVIAAEHWMYQDNRPPRDAWDRARDAWSDKPEDL